MGKIVTIEYFDDLEGTSIDGKTVDTVEFSYRGQDYTLVLTKKNGAQFDKDISRYITAARKAQSRETKAAHATTKTPPKKTSTPKPAAQQKNPRPKTTAKATASKAAPTGAIRRWAADNGHEVSSRGRIPAAVLEAFNAAH